jgi:hypothetical protein
MATDKDIEKEIVDKGLVAPRVTPADIEAVIVGEHYFTAGQGFRYVNHKLNPADEPTCPQSLDLLTFCVLELKNGFTVHGFSGVASPENFNKEIGQKIARQDAVNKIWPLLGYELKTKLSTDRNVFYIDAGDLSEAEVVAYIEKMKANLRGSA